jgi:ABC-type transport system substrate-binding protein
MNLADAQQATDPEQATATWAAVDRAVTFAAPWVPLANMNNVDFLSARVTNYQYNPFFGILLDQLQIRKSLWTISPQAALGGVMTQLARCGIIECGI